MFLCTFKELGKLDFKINVISNWLEKYMSFSLENELVSIDSFNCFLSSSFDENDFKYLGQ